MNADEYIKALAKPGVSREIEDDGDINDDIPTRNNTSRKHVILRLSGYMPPPN